MKEITKKLRNRIALITLLLATMVLVDEIVKEGYMIDPVDFINPRITHEKIFLVLFIISLFFGLRRRRG